MSIDSKSNVEFQGNNPEDIVNLIDSMVQNGTSRIKIKVSEEQDLNTVIKEYHHGRCDINSPFACGNVFDLLEDDN